MNRPNVECCSSATAGKIARSSIVWYCRLLMSWLQLPQIKWAIPIPLLIALAPLVWLFFRSTWRELDDDAFAYRRALHDRGEIDYRPLVALTMAALVLTLHEYFGGWAFYHDKINPSL